MAKTSDNMRRIMAIDRRRRSLLRRCESQKQLSQLRIERELSAFEKKCVKQLDKLSMVFDYSSLQKQKFEIAIKKFDVIKNHYAYRKVNHAYTEKLFQLKSGEYQNKRWAEGIKGGVEEISAVLHTQYIEDLYAVREKRRAFITKRQVILGKALEKAPAQQQIADAKQAFEKNKQEFSQQYDELRETLILEEKQKLESFNEKIRAKIALLTDEYNEYSVNTPTLDEKTCLKVENLCMYFGGLRAVEDLTFDVKKGEIFGLIGPNGAGKTTVFNCITQFYKATRGNIYFNTRDNVTIDLRSRSIHDVVLSGIARTFQNVEVIKEVSVLENMLIAATRQYNSGLLGHMFHSALLKKEEQDIRQKAQEILEFMGLSSYKNWLAWGLPYGILKRIEIARTLMCKPSLIIMDEPAAGLNDTETKELAKLIKEIRVKYNCAIFLVEHDMGLVMDICDRICAISFGKMLALGTPKEIQKDKRVQEAYLGVEG